jgi:acyl-CoA thioester hydrolase
MSVHETRASYAHRLDIPTRWMDNDIYGHVNNVVYYSFFDTIINEYLIREGGLDIARGPVIGVAIETQCRFARPLTFPQTIEGGLRVQHIGTSSVRYEIGLFSPDAAQPAATGTIVHVFVDRESRRPTPIPASIRSALERLVMPATPP